MAKDQIKDLLKFLKPFPEDVQAKALWLREFVWDLYPQTNELIYDNYNAVAFGWSITDRVGHVFCTIAVGRTSHHVHFGFYWGSQISDPKNLLIGEGKQYRYILLKDIADFPKVYFQKLLKEAYENSLAKVKDPKQIIHGRTIVKSVSDVKRTKNKSKIKEKEKAKPRNAPRKKK